MKNNKFLPYAGATALVLVSVLLVIGIAVSLYRISSPAAEAGPQGFITVSASGMALASPSQAVISMTVNGTGATVQDAVANMSASVSGLNSTLYGYVDSNMSKVSTTYYYTYKTYNRSTYTAVEGISATIPNISDVNPLLGELSSIRNVYVTGVSAQLSADQITSMRSTALRAALLNATEQAGVLASPMHVKLTNVSISNYVVYPMYAGADALAKGSSGSATPTFFSGMSRVTESVTAVFSYR